MDRKPTYEELEQRVKELEKEAVEGKRVEKALRKARDELERRLNERTAELVRTTAELVRANEKLKQEIEERKRAEQRLRKALDGLETLVEERTVAVVKAYRKLKQEIEDRKRSEEALRESEEKYRLLFDESRDVIYIATREGKFVDINQSGLDLLGYTREEIMGLNARELYVHPEDRLRFQHDIEQKGFVRDYEVKFRKKDGTEMYCLLTSTVRRARDGSISGYQGIIRDITQRKWAEEHIRHLNQQLIKAQENERQRLSHDLHDHLAQDLSALKIGLDTLFVNDPEERSDPRQRISGLSEMLRGIILAIRNMAYDLGPAGLDQIGLVQTVQEHCEEFSSKNTVKVDCFATGIDDSKLDFDTKVTLYRVVQEGLNNIKNHADASHATIRLVGSFPNIILCIEDDGQGFDVQNRLAAAVDERRMGLWGMKERVALIQGKMKIESGPMRGTKILIEVPCKGENNGE
jgi:PAS domain S-box-containing protein